MTRANLNFVYGDDKVLYYYQNGDQYPVGIRDYYHLLDFIKSDWTVEAFKKWLGDNYTKTRRMVASNATSGVSLEYNEDTKIPAKAEKKTFAITGDNESYTDYSYLFNAKDKSVKVWNWDKVIFEGKSEEFIKWINKQEL